VKVTVDWNVLRLQCDVHGCHELARWHVGKSLRSLLVCSDCRDELLATDGWEMR
jgi:hypothetical protein